MIKLIHKPRTFWLHFFLPGIPVGMLCHWCWPAAIISAFWFWCYETNEDGYLKDRAYQDIQGAIAGVIVTALGMRLLG